MATGESLLFDRSSFQLFKSTAKPASEGTVAGYSKDFLICDMPPDLQTALMRRLHFVLGDGHLQGMHAAVEAKIKDRVATSDVFARLRRELVANGSLPSVSAWQGQLPSLPPQSLDKEVGDKELSGGGMDAGKEEPKTALDVITLAACEYLSSIVQRLGLNPGGLSCVEHVPAHRC